MDEAGLTADELKRQNAAAIAKSQTFETRGVSLELAEDYLLTPDGRRYQQMLMEADPKASLEAINDRAIGQIRSGRNIPSIEVIDEPLFKVVPRGSSPSPYTPFFGKQSDFIDEVAKGQRIHDRFGLPIASEAPVYDVFRIDPKKPTEVFVSQIAPTSELGGQIQREGGARQYLVPNRASFHDATHVTSMGNDLATHQRFVVATGLGAPIEAIREPAIHGLRNPGVAKGLGALGVAATAYDAADTLHDVNRMRGQGNATASEERITRFAAQNLGGWGGAVAGAGVGAAAGVETGPGLLVSGAIGGVVGAVAGDKVADWIRDYKINNQSDRNGNTWTFDPDAPSRGWTRRELDLDAMRSSEGAPVYKPGELKADAALSSELTYKASSRSIELALGQPPQGNDPYRLPANAAEQAQRTPFETGRTWLRDADTGQWQQEIRSNPDGRASLTRHEAATPERALQLDAQSQAVIAANAARTPAAVAAQFQAAYDHNGWSHHGPLPKAVEEAKTHPGRIMGSDGNPYDRGADGRWTHEGLLWDSRADGNLKRELDATYQHQQKTLGIKTLETVQVRPDPHALGSASKTVASAASIHSPHDAMRDRIDASVREIDRQVGKPWDQHSERMSASALMLATKAGFKPGDNVQVSLSTATSEQPAGANLLVMRTGGGTSADPAANRAAMPTQDALAMPAEQRLQQVAEIGQSHAAQQQRDSARSQDESTRQVASVGGR